MYIVTKRLYFM